MEKSEMYSNWTKCTFAIPADLAETFAWLLAQALDLPIETCDETTMSKWLDGETPGGGIIEGSPPDTLENEVHESANN